MANHSKSAFRAAIALSLGTMLAGCGDVPNNAGLDSVRQPVIERSNLTLDLNATAGGLAVAEKRRLAEWFETLNLRYGDRVALDGMVYNDAAREDVAAAASRHGLLLSEGAPVTAGQVAPGAIRVVVTRSRAHVPGCPDWSDQFSSNLDNSTSDNFGCAVNSNIAAMIADPEHLLQGAQGTGETVVMSSTKAIEAYRKSTPTGGVPATVSTGGN
jgi:pilus assembly protein CpaD